MKRRRRPGPRWHVARSSLVERPRRVLASERRPVREERGAPALQPAFVLHRFRDAGQAPRSLLRCAENEDGSGDELVTVALALRASMDHDVGLGPRDRRPESVRSSLSDRYEIAATASASGIATGPVWWSSFGSQTSQVGRYQL